MMEKINNFRDAAGDLITERTIQFILSLAPPTRLKIIESDMMFIDDKPNYDLYLARNKQLKEAISYSRNSGQYIFYDEIYKPALKILANAPIPDICKKTQATIDRQIDDLVLYLNGLPKVEATILNELHFFPDNVEQTTKLMKSLDLPNDPYLSWDHPKYGGIAQAICKVRDLADKTPYIMPAEYKIESIPIPIWEPNTSIMQSEAFSLGYFTGPAGLQFYTPVCHKSVSTAPTVAAINEARFQKSQAHSSKILSYQLIVKEKLNVIRISNSRIIYAVQNVLLVPSEQPF